MEPIHAELPNKGFDNKPSTGLTSITVCLDSGMLPTDACRADPRGNRVGSFEAAVGTGPTEECTIHRMVGYCTEGHCLAGETCPESVVEQRAYLDYVREDYGPSIKAEDDPYLISTLEKAKEPSETNPSGGCPVHEGVPLPDPDIPVDPYEPYDPDTPNYSSPEEDPGIYIPPEERPGYSGGNGGGGTTAPEPPATPDLPPTTPSEPVEPVTPAPNPDGGGLFDDLWNNA